MVSLFANLRDAGVALKPSLKSQAIQTLQRLGGLEDSQRYVLEPVGCAQPLGYRNKLTFTVDTDVDSLTKARRSELGEHPTVGGSFACTLVGGGGALHGRWVFCFVLRGGGELVMVRCLIHLRWGREGSTISRKVAATSLRSFLMTPFKTGSTPQLAVQMAQSTEHSCSEHI